MYMYYYISYSINYCTLYVLILLLIIPYVQYIKVNIYVHQTIDKIINYSIQLYQLAPIMLLTGL